MIPMRHSLKLLIPLALVATGCRLISPYTPPPVEVPYGWKEQSYQMSPSKWKWEAPAEAECSCGERKEESSAEGQNDEAVPAICGQIENWWEVFEDPVLNELEQRAVESNYSLWAAVERVNQARAVARATYASLFPTLVFAPSYSNSEMLVRNPVPTPTVNNPLIPTVPKEFRLRQTQYTLPLTLSYEVDLWNSLENTYLSAKYRAEAAYEAYRTVLLSLTADVAIAYFQARGLDTERFILEKNIAILQDAYDINSARFKAGLSLYIDVTRALSELASVKADLADVMRRRALQENILAILVGTPASDFSLANDPLQGTPPGIPPDAPIELLARRPDIAQAERLIASAYAQIGVAYAAFYPSLNLTGSLGFESPKLSSLLSWKARLWAYAANAMLTLFDAGRNQANLRYAAAAYSEAVANYEQQTLIAFKDVEDALASLYWEAEQRKQLVVAVEASIQTVSLATIRYRQGLSSYLDVVDAERNALSNERQAARSQTARYLSTVMLVKALGGGWTRNQTLTTPCFENEGE